MELALVNTMWTEWYLLCVNRRFENHITVLPLLLNHKSSMPHTKPSPSASVSTERKSTELPPFSGRCCLPLGGGKCIMEVEGRKAHTCDQGRKLRKSYYFSHRKIIYPNPLVSALLMWFSNPAWLTCSVNCQQKGVHAASEKAFSFCHNYSIMSQIGAVTSASFPE